QLAKILQHSGLLFSSRPEHETRLEDFEVRLQRDKISLQDLLTLLGSLGVVDGALTTPHSDRENPPPENARPESRLTFALRSLDNALRRCEITDDALSRWLERIFKTRDDEALAAEERGRQAQAFLAKINCGVLAETRKAAVDLAGIDLVRCIEEGLKEASTQQEIMAVVTDRIDEVFNDERLHYLANLIGNPLHDHTLFFLKKRCSCSQQG
ncbi:unnamed protein product, partial [Amoebophrya sp. A25]